jgi:L-lactate dehydrogenase complex protein LldE
LQIHFPEITIIVMSRTIQLFITCIIDSLYPEVGEAVVRVLQRAGADVAFPEKQTCCGQPAFNAGMHAQARQMAEHNIKVFESVLGPVVVPSGSCTAMDLAARFPGKITYHPSCHLTRELGVSRQPRALLRSVHDSEFVELPHQEECCGFGGLFSVEFPEISGEMMSRKIENIEASGASLVVSCDAGCISNINGGLHRQGKPPRAIHIAELLDKGK